MTLKMFHHGSSVVDYELEIKWKGNSEKPQKKKKNKSSRIKTVKKKSNF